MKVLIEVLVKAVVRGILYSAGFAVIGGLIGLVLKKGFIQGAYILVLAGACVAMLVAAYGFIGSPKKRFSFFTQNRYEDLVDQDEGGITDPTEKHNDVRPDKEAFRGLYPTIIAIEMLVIGFIIEAMLH